MMIETVVEVIQVWLIPLTIAIVAVLALRTPWRMLFGSRVAYGLWLLPPAALIVALLPASGPAPMIMSESIVWLKDSGSVALASSGMHETDIPVIGSIWLAGFLISLSILVVREWRFHGSLGNLKRVRQGLWRASGRLESPALIGIFRPRIVIPDDFEQRYSVRQQRLILQHEAIHRSRGDHWFNAIAAILLCVFWFHPLLDWAFGCFRRDQEMACDARVLEAFPGWRRSYGEALLPAIDAFPSATACRWSLTHPVKERIIMLQKPPKSSACRKTGTLLILGPALLLAAGVHGESVPDPHEDMVYLELQAEWSLPGEQSTQVQKFTVGTTPEKPATVSTDMGEHGVIIFSIDIESVENDLVDVKFEFEHDGEQLAEPWVRFRIDDPEGASIQIAGDPGSAGFRLHMIATRDEPVIDWPPGHVDDL